MTGKQENVPFYNFIAHFEIEAGDAVALGVLTEPKWHYYSDIRGDQMRDAEDAILRNTLAPLAAAIRSQP